LTSLEPLRDVIRFQEEVAYSIRSQVFGVQITGECKLNVILTIQRTPLGMWFRSIARSSYLGTAQTIPYVFKVGIEPKLRMFAAHQN